VIIFGEAISDPIALGGKFDNRHIVGIVMFTFPRHIDFKRGGLITGVLGVAMMPWELLKNPARYVGGWLVGYSGSLGAIAGVLIVDYWVLRKRTLDLA